MRKITILLALCLFAGCATTVKEAPKPRYEYKPHVWESLYEITDNVPYMTDFEKEVLLFINQARTDPKKFATKHFKDHWSPDEQRYAAMIKLKPMGPLRPSKELYSATSSFVEEWWSKGRASYSKKIPDAKSRCIKITGNYNVYQARLMYTQSTIDRMYARNEAFRLIFSGQPYSPEVLNITMMSTLENIAIVFRPIRDNSFMSFRSAMVTMVTQ